MENNNKNIIDLVFFSMVPDDKFFFDYNTDIYIKDQVELNKYISNEFTDFLRWNWLFRFLANIWINLIDAYYIDWTQIGTWNGIFAIWVELKNPELLINYLHSRIDIIEYYMQHIRIPNSRRISPDDEEDSFEWVIETVYNQWIPQCLTSIIKKDFWILSNDLISQINENAEWDDFLTKDHIIEDDIEYLKHLDFLENFRKSGLKYEWFIGGENGWIKYYYFSRLWKNSFMYKVELIKLSFENYVEIEHVEPYE